MFNRTAEPKPKKPVPVFETFGGWAVTNDTIKKPGTRQKYPVVGAVAEFEHGANIGARITATRVLLTGVFALALKKDRNKVYVLVQLANGEQLLIEGPAKKERQAREFVAVINRVADVAAP